MIHNIPFSPGSELAWDRAKFAHFPAGGRSGSPERPERALFLDRDGLLIEDVDFLRKADQISIMPGVPEFLREAQPDFCLIVVTNQSGIARGYITEDDLYGIHHELINRFAGHGVQLDALYYCPHLPGASINAYNRVCDCRKPAPGMIQQAATDWNLRLDQSVMVGDSLRDVQAGEAAGVMSFLLGPSPEEETTKVQTVDQLASLLPLLRSVSCQNNVMGQDNG
jgi:D-glycero-D-manno-heptose 1,7-bisphosphate phosphatase